LKDTSGKPLDSCRLVPESSPSARRSVELRDKAIIAVPSPSSARPTCARFAEYGYGIAGHLPAARHPDRVRRPGDRHDDGF
jgi:hypothetical protein